MKKLTKKRSKKIGLPPGTPVHIGDEKTAPVTISVINYSETLLNERKLQKIEECFPLIDTSTVPSEGTASSPSGRSCTWINIDGLHKVDIIEKIGANFKLHPLTLEDIVNTEQRPKMEDYGDYLFLVLKMLTYGDKTHEIHTEQVSLILGSNFIISFLEDPGDVFDPVRERLRKSGGKIRKSGADYLAYRLMDAVIDHYYLILEKLGDRIESLEEELVTRPSQTTLHNLHSLKRSMIFLRKSVWPLRELISGLERSESVLIQKTTRVFLRDIYDHTIQVIDTMETFRDMVSGMLDIYLSSISYKMNEIMKVLTIIATIFIPLTFVAGVYGMNFDNMPELRWHWGYFYLWGVMAAIALVMLFYFRKKKWM